MWVSLQYRNTTKMAPLSDRATIGSSLSNTFVVDFAEMKALRGVFIKQAQEWIFKDFEYHLSHPIHLGAQLQLGPLQFEFRTWEQLWEAWGTQILKSFRENLKDASAGQALELLKKNWSLDRILHDEMTHPLNSQKAELEFCSPIEVLLAESEISDVLVESYDRIYVERGGVLQQSALRFSSEESYEIYLENLLRRAQKTVDESKPFADFVLSDGSRGHYIMPPATRSGRYLSIRKPRSWLWSLETLFNKKMFSASVFDELKNAVSSGKNILVSGATGSGKTSLMKALIHSVPSEQRILIIEDTPELDMKRSNTAFLTTRVDSQGQLPKISLRELVRQGLRMRPDRMIIGEVRGEEAMDLLHAMNTGHRGCMGSLHSNSVRDAVWRLQGLVQLSDASLSNQATMDLIARNIHMVVHCERDPSGSRRVSGLGYLRGVDSCNYLIEERPCA